MNDIVWFPQELDLIEAGIDRAIAQDERRAPSLPSPDEVSSYNIDVVRRAVDEWETRCAMAEAAIDAVNTADAEWADLNRAEAEYEAAVAVLAALEDRLAELEDAAERDGEDDSPMGFRAMYFAIKI